MRRFIVDPDLAKLVAQHVEPEDAKTVIFECNPGMYCICVILNRRETQRWTLCTFLFGVLTFI